jgi:ACS family glucarate transporter-like MFS transporter
VSEIPPSHRWLIVGLLFAAALINYLDRATISVALPLISRDFALGPVTKGLVLSSFFWSYAVMQVPAGWWADRINLRGLYAGMFVLWSLACGLTGLAGGVTTLILFRLLLGIGESIYLPGSSKIVSILYAPPERGLPAGLADCGTRAGLALGAPLVAWLVDLHGWRTMFFLVGFSALAWVVPWWLVFPARLGSEKRRSAPEFRGAAAQPAAPRRTGAVTFNRNLFGVSLGFLCFGYYWYLLLTWLPDYLVNVRHLSVLKAGIYASLPYAVFGVSMPLGGWLADRLIRRGWNDTRTRKGMVSVAFLTGLLLIPATHVASAQTAIWLVAGASLVGLSTSNLQVILQCCAPPEEVGVWTGIQNLAGTIGGIIAPLLTGFLISWTGSYSPGFLLAALTLVAGLAAYWFVVGELRPPGSPTRHLG